MQMLEARKEPSRDLLISLFNAGGECNAYVVTCVSSRQAGLSASDSTAPARVAPLSQLGFHDRNQGSPAMRGRFKLHESACRVSETVDQMH